METRRTCMGVLLAALVVYLIAQAPALASRFVINDDVRQQVYWMQRWVDPGLFPDDLLSRYAENYVPWGVQAVYYLASSWIDPVPFSKVLAGVLFVLNAGLLFALGRRMRSERYGVLLVFTSFFFTTYTWKIVGGLSQSFVFPLLIAYLVALAYRRLGYASLVLLAAAIFNPYAFVLIAATHLVFLGRALWHDPSAARDPGRLARLGRLVSTHVPALVGAVLVFVRHVVLAPTEFGPLARWADLMGPLEYGPAGRYPIVPVPSLPFELVRPWTLFLPLADVRPAVSATAWGLAMIAAGLLTWRIRTSARRTRESVPGPDCAERVAPTVPPPSLPTPTGDGFGIFGPLLLASVALWALSYVVLMRLFLPERYTEYTFALIATALVARLLDWLWMHWRPDSAQLIRVAAFFTLLAGLRNYHLGLVDAAPHAALVQFLATTPRDSVIAGPPDVMDDVVTFSARTAFVTYELSHTWYLRYWQTIKQRTAELYHAYYAREPAAVERFLAQHRITHLVVREEDFSPARLVRPAPYFEPFDGKIRALIGPGGPFALAEPSTLVTVYRGAGFRVLVRR